MRLRNVPGAREAVEQSPHVVQDAHALKGRWRSLFDGRQALHVEIGAGKGNFLFGMAALHPDTAFIGIERYATVLFKALNKMPEALSGQLRFVRMDAEIVTEVFETGEVDRIYLNFSDPWPKERHAKRRLTSGLFLSRYERVLKSGGRIEFKTDNDELFDFSLNEFSSERELSGSSSILTISLF